MGAPNSDSARSTSSERASGILPEGPSLKAKSVLPAGRRQHVADLPHAHPVATAPFMLREDGSIGTPASGTARSKQTPNAGLDQPSLPSFAWLRRTGGSFRLLPHCGIRRDKSARQGSALHPQNPDTTLSPREERAGTTIREAIP
jgi:hypothetical protein